MDFLGTVTKERRDLTMTSMTIVLDIVDHFNWGDEQTNGSRLAGMSVLRSFVRSNVSLFLRVLIVRVDERKTTDRRVLHSNRNTEVIRGAKNIHLHAKKRTGPKISKAMTILKTRTYRVSVRDCFTTFSPPTAR